MRVGFSEAEGGAIVVLLEAAVGQEVLALVASGEGDFEVSLTCVDGSRFI